MEQYCPQFYVFYNDLAAKQGGSNIKTSKIHEKNPNYYHNPYFLAPNS
jgi:hypothetical protein